MLKTKITSAFALAALLATCATGQTSTLGTVEGIVIPGGVAAKEPFTFAVTGVVEGEVIEIKTVEGEVVAQKRTDKLGRVFLAAGLSAGAYLISKSDGSGTIPGRINVPPTLENAPLPKPLSGPSLFKFSDPVHMSGSSIDPDARNLTCLVGRTGVLPVLASSQREAIMASPQSQGIKPGVWDLSLSDSDGHVVASKRVAFCEISATLGQSKVISGGKTTLQFKMTPGNIDASIVATVVSGPIRFQENKSQTTVAVRNGGATVPVQTTAGQSGKFQIGWMFMPDTGYQPPSEDPRTKKITDELEEKRKKDEKNSDGSGTKTKKDEKDRIVEKDKYDKNGDSVEFDSYLFEGEICVYEQHMKKLKGGGYEHHVIFRDKDGKVTSDEKNTFDKDGSHTDGTKTKTDKDGNTTTKTYDKDTNTWK